MKSAPAALQIKQLARVQPAIVTAGDLTADDHEQGTLLCGHTSGRIGMFRLSAVAGFVYLP